MVWLYGFTQLHLFHDLPNNEILRGTIFTTRNLWLLNCIAKKASTKRSWKWHQRPTAKNRQFSTESPNLFTFFPLVYEYKWFLRPSYEAAEHFQTQAAGGVVASHAEVLRGSSRVSSPRMSADLSGKKGRPITADFQIWEVHFGPREISRSTFYIAQEKFRKVVNSQAFVLCGYPHNLVEKKLPRRWNLLNGSRLSYSYYYDNDNFKKQLV